MDKNLDVQAELLVGDRCMGPQCGGSKFGPSLVRQKKDNNQEVEMAVDCWILLREMIFTRQTKVLGQNFWITLETWGAAA